MAEACCKRVCCDNERCKIVSDAVFFFKIGFLSRYEFGVPRRLDVGDVGVISCLLYVFKGPYSQVTSQSFSLRQG